MAKTRTERKERIPVSGPRSILDVKGKDPNYEYYWVLAEIPGRLERFKDAGYEVVVDDLEVGESTVDKESKLGSAVSKKSGGRTLVLHRILKEWWEEDQARKQDKVDLLEASMQREANEGFFPASRSSDRGSYVPEGGGLQIGRNRG